MKIKDELNAKEEAKALNEKPYELTDEQLEQVTGGIAYMQIADCHHKGSFAFRSGYFSENVRDINYGNECVHFMGGDGGCDLD